MAEVSPRSPGLKGGALVVDEHGNRILTEDPSFDSTWRAVVSEMQEQGFQLLSKQDAARILVDHFEEGSAIAVEPTRMDTAGGILNTTQLLQDLRKTDEDEAKEPRRFEVFQSGNQLRVVRHI